MAPLTRHPTVTLHVTHPAPAVVQRRLRELLTERCGPCNVVFQRATPADPWATHTTCEVSGPWLISPAQVHEHLAAVFSQLVP